MRRSPESADPEVCFVFGGVVQEKVRLVLSDSKGNSGYHYNFRGGVSAFRHPLRSHPFLSLFLGFKRRWDIGRLRRKRGRRWFRVGVETGCERDANHEQKG